MSAENPTKQPEKKESINMEVTYSDSLDGITAEKLQGFFVGWPKPPTRETLLTLLEKSDYKILALDDQVRVAGFITAISDGVLSAYIPFLEVLPEYKGKGIGSKLTQQMLEKLKDLYMVDLLCDPELQAFYEQAGMEKATGMMLRNYSNQKGKEVK
jgi:ribosomal protein S18 acetylase RimI-like enzyme